MFWEVAKVEPDLMPFAINAVTPHTAVRSFRTNDSQPPQRIEFWIRMRPMGVDVLQDLVKSGHLDPAIIQAMPTYAAQHYEAIVNREKQRYEVRELTTPDCESYTASFSQ